jgi:hypothetical protein
MIRGLALVAVAAACGCGGARPSPTVTASTLEQRAAAVDRDANSMTRKSGASSMGDASSKFDAFFENGRLRLIAEKLSLGEYGSSVNRYYFDDAVYFAFEEKTRVNLAPAASGAAEKISLRIFFTPDGAVLDGRKSVGGERAIVEDTDARGALLHANALREAALKLP